uniref:Uncharacterized protein, isoform A n=1 Tax=Drosophila melanogaster TaxID=7227 RepID=A0A384TTL1_DROME|nr:uncharacterized protein Dmel_CG46305, isoform A [Drosophila melanogaster]NP_001334722.1 uncharacterized protein Dmel_CG46305, isoform B [Drosophila melanogaster]API64968.1 uncharacterized protein Dmel_CG43172, isoform A [Drosophila melanogaster]API64969.1 uncharacterized protein Dmel_CG43172, isoform B [Drosophila melanogaster]|eukprot:NP_001334721.1 uncharacterized protein Dmel_CG46305, isoform A [Drosophila melanogaster]
MSYVICFGMGMVFGMFVCRRCEP